MMPTEIRSQRPQRVRQRQILMTVWISWSDLPMERQQRVINITQMDCGRVRQSTARQSIISGMATSRLLWTWMTVTGTALRFMFVAQICWRNSASRVAMSRRIISIIHRMPMAMWWIWRMQMVLSQSRIPTMHLVWSRILMMQIRMRSGIVGNTMMRKRVRFICGQDTIVRLLVDLFREILS